MAIQAILGIPVLAGIIGAVFTSLIEFFGKYLTKKVATVASAIVVIGTVTFAFIAGIEALFAGIYYALPSGMGNWTVFLPSNITVCISAIVTGEVLRWAYDWNVKIIQWKLF